VKLTVGQQEMHITPDDLFKTFRDLLGPAIQLEGESAMVANGCAKVGSIGYATNLTPETVRGARAAAVDILITHHDAWDFIYGMQEDCHSALNRWGIAHFYAHLPLDAAPFGTAASLIQGLGAAIGKGIAKHNDYPQGMMGTFESPLSLETAAERMRSLTGEDCRIWPCGSSTISALGVVTGCGALTSYVKEAADFGCQLYITGEQSLYLIQYCMSIGMNLMVGSHTFTELPGVRALAIQVQERHPGLQLIEIPEAHYETLPDKAVQWTPLRDAIDL
jgi:putative NIF3 family GTP cyclohydrolase 1 type 2